MVDGLSDSIGWGGYHIGKYSIFGGILKAWKYAWQPILTSQTASPYLDGLPVL
jgi:hypothetical protein